MTCSAFRATAINRPLSVYLPSASRYQHCPRPLNPLSPAYGRNAQASLCHGYPSTPTKRGQHTDSGQW